MEARWTRIMPVAEIPEGGACTVKQGGKQLAVFRAGGEVHAIDNRCPHEGYPLASGALQEGVLTCEWHNWKFRLCDGVCVLGGEDVQRYRTRVEDGVVWIDLADPPALQKIPALHAGLVEAADERDWGRAARTIERLLEAGEPPARILARVCELAALRAPYGIDHGPATAADAAALLEEHPEEADVILLEATNLVLDDQVRQPNRTLAAPEAVAGLDEASLETELRRRIEAQDLTGAEALVRGALAAGAGPEPLFRWITHAATDHFLDYGHGHIYCVKVEELLRRIGWASAEPLLCGLVCSLVNGTREDRLPYMRQYVALMERHAPRLETWREQGPGAGIDVDGFLAAILDGALEDALDATAGALDAGMAPDRLALCLALAAAHRVWRFDASLEQRDDVAEGWLDATHALTHADAVRETLLRRPSADALRGLFHAARFIQHMAPLDGAERAAPPDEPPDAAALCRSALGGHATVPIFVDHHVKTSFAARRLTAALRADPLLASRPDADLPLHAAARFVASPLRERRIARAAAVAREFVRHGRRHHTLLGY
ncbi:MAG TPA: Rieske (2Fe-2S) protein [Kofleriaceae bacterium]|nr:Rieske (2Fe-2S) protein [Kofleriaceae bacterium]